MKLINKLYIFYIYDYKIKIYRDKNKLLDDFSNVYKNVRLICFRISVLICIIFLGSGKGLLNVVDSNFLVRFIDLCRRFFVVFNNCNK